MPSPKPLSKEHILAAMGKTKSNRAAARYLNVSYTHYKIWAKFYSDESTGVSLFEKHKNQSGKGIPKFLTNGKKDPAIIDVIEGRIDPSHFNPQKIKYRLLQEGYLKEECSKCGFHERRVSDYKMPLLMHFKDGNKKHYRLENLEMLCYNCYFIYIDNIFTDKDLQQLEDHKPINETTEAVHMELDEYQVKRLKELGLYDTPKGEDEDPYSLVSRI
jgi:hypothetical protein